VYYIYNASMNESIPGIGAGAECRPQALSHIRVLELGQLIAGPYCAKLLADFGAQVIKVEPPDGDPLRSWRLQRDGTSLWWQIQSRNKKSIVLDLRTDQGREVARQLACESDVLIENFKPGTLESWGLGWKELSELNPRLVMLRVSGYGQYGPYRDLPGFGAMAEAMGGLRHLTGEPGRLPVRTGLAIGDTAAALYGAVGVLIALYHRDLNGGRGQAIDVALYESVYSLTDSLISEYRTFGTVRGPAGSSLPGVAPTNAYRCVDGIAIIAGNGDSIFKRLMRLIGREDLAIDPQLGSNEGRARRAEELDDAISAWSMKLSLDQALKELAAAKVPASRIYTAKDISEDPHYQARAMFETIRTEEGSTLDIPGIVPKLSLTPGAHRAAAPKLGQHTREILSTLGCSDSTIAGLLTKTGGA
jgi:formyl-CoA transferase